MLATRWGCGSNLPTLDAHGIALGNKPKRSFSNVRNVLDVAKMHDFALRSITPNEKK
jgi:hypothetical protein